MRRPLALGLRARRIQFDQRGADAVLDPVQRIDVAAALLAESVRLYPEVAETRSSLGMALAAQGRPEEAAAQFAEALRLRPDFPEARRNLALLRSRLRPREPSGRIPRAGGPGPSAGDRSQK